VKFRRGDKTHVFIVTPDAIYSLHDDAIPMGAIGPYEVHRASNVEFNNDTNLWEGVIRPEFRQPGHHHTITAMSREDCLAAERYYFEHIWEPRS